jgi:tyrosyl-tRNA synthetase
MRPALSKEEVEKNAETYREQVFKILDPKETEILYNSSWLSKMSLEEVLRLSKCYTVARMLERDDFAKRYSKGKPITICEFLYPLLQGYDSVVVNADIEVGGSDQRFNLLLGRAVQQAYGKRPQVIFTMPLLEGTDGKAKMSKSYGNYIGITEPEDAMFGKLMSISDELMIRYYQLLTDEDTEKIERDIKSGKLHPMKAKEELAWKITSLYHSKEAADRALIGFRRVFSERKVPEKILEYQIDRAIRLVSLIYEAGLTESKSEARRLISQGAVSVDGEKIRDMDYLLHPTHSQILKVGKRRFLKVSGAKV